MRAPSLVLAILLTQPTFAATGGSFPAADPARAENAIESGFDLLYNLKFSEARALFARWQKAHPDDPLGDVSIAASHLFEEFHSQRVLTSEFFLDDDRLLGGIRGKPHASRKASFTQANERARALARRRLEANPRDADALFALTLAAGMQADYETILEKHQMKGLSLIKEAARHAKRLLELRPDAADAWLALGAANYIVGSLPKHKRFFLWFGRIHGSKRLGMQQLRRTAENGHYLRPFAKIFLALAAMRERQHDVARKQLSDLAAEFPNNPMFAASSPG